MNGKTLYFAAAVGTAWLWAMNSPALTLEYQFYPTQTVPSSQTWTANFGTDDSETIIPNHYLQITDNDSGDPGYFYTRSVPVGDINSETDWQVRTQVRLTSYGSSPADRGLYSMFVGDGSNLVIWGMRLDGSGNTRVFHATSIGGENTLAASVTGNPFLEIVSTKTTGANPGSFSDDTVLLQVFDFGGNLLGSATQNLGNIGIASSTRQVLFGLSASPSFGTAQVIGATFGIGENAPLIIPEPAAAALGLFGGLLLWRRMRQR